MMRSMYSGVSGLKTHQVKMDVIGNNIANVNTVAFKSSSTVFSELMSQNLSGASGASSVTGRGGINAKQIGLGVTTGSTTVNINAAGATQTTGEAFDLKINGNSFFVVNDGQSNYFTKAGSFYIDGAGNLAMKSTGYNVMGWQVDPTTGAIKKDTVSPLRILQEKNMTSSPEATTQATVGGILDKNATNVNAEAGQIMSLTFFDSLGYQYTAKFAIKAAADGSSKDSGTYTVELSDILDANSQSIVKDADGNVTVPGGLGDLFGGAAGSYNLQFDTASGTFLNIGGANNQSLNLSALGGQFANINVDFTQTKWFDNGGASTISMEKGGLDSMTGTGKKLGALIGVAVSQDGTIWGSYDNGNTVLLAQVAVGNFPNPAGLEKRGDNCYKTTLNSGDFDGIGQDITANGESMSSGVLEMSNVDLSSEFTEMITTQRGFQANSRVITTSDTMLDELINLKR